jgi:hypothetical protein
VDFSSAISATDKTKMSDRQQIVSIRTDKAEYDHMVQLWPITVEIYPTGHVAFIARPGGRGKRWNKTFSTASLGSPEEAAREAIDFCKRVLSGTDDEVNHLGKIRERKKLARYGFTEKGRKLYFELRKLGIDVDELLEREYERATITALRARWEKLK